MEMGQILIGVGCGFALLLIGWHTYKKSKIQEVKPVTPLPSFRALNTIELYQFIISSWPGSLERLQEDGKIILMFSHPDRSVTVVNGSSQREALISLAEKLGAK
jgi:hypothetical protein